MVDNKYNALDEDEYDTLSRDSLDSPRHSTSDSGQDQDFRNERGQMTTIVSSRREVPEIDTGVATRNTRENAGAQQSSEASKEIITWKDLPKKDQLLVITLARLSEPLTQTSLQVRMFL